MKLNSLEELFLLLLSDTYFVETQSLDVLPALAKKAHSEELKSAFMHHLNQTKNQVHRLEQIFLAIGEEPQNVEWARDLGSVFSDMQQIVKENPSSPLLDAALITAGQRVEHFEIATYTTLKALANSLGLQQTIELLDETLKEEFQTAHLLFQMCEDAFDKATQVGSRW